MTVAVVGLGQMGAGIAASLARTGADVLGVDPAAPQTPDGVARTELADAVQRAEVLVLSLPGAETERQILDLVEAEQHEPAKTVQAVPLAELQEAQKTAMAVHLSPELRDYTVRLVMATREGPQAADVEHAVSPRGSLALASAAKARAYLRGRDYALPEDVEALAPDALAHRMVLTWRAVAEGRKPRDVVAAILAEVEAL